MEIGSQQWDSTGFTENFAYDNLNRLSSSNVNGQPVQNFTYDAAGNLTSKTGVGSGLYSYPAQGANSVLPHAVQSIAGIGSFSYDANGNLSSDARRTLSWSSFDMPAQISQGSITANFVYGPEHQRTRQTRSDGSVVIYAGAQEVETKAGQITVKTYWPYGVGVEIDRPLATATEFNWIHTDRLGSPVALSAEDGTLREKLAYDAWGKRRTLDGVAINGTATPDSIVGQIDNRGFTGHEMLDQLDLVHMNGRIYDPLVGRFLSADPILQDPMNGQSYNRYSYVLNNPTNLTDPTGFEATGFGSWISSMMGDDREEEKRRTQNTIAGLPKGEVKDSQGNARTDPKNGAVSESAIQNITPTFAQKTIAEMKGQGGYGSIGATLLEDASKFLGTTGITTNQGVPYDYLANQFGCQSADCKSEAIASGISFGLGFVGAETRAVKEVGAAGKTLIIPKEKAEFIGAYQKAADEGKLIRTDPSTVRGSGFRNSLSKEKGPPPGNGYDADHRIELCVGGANCAKTNGQWLESGRNRTAGSQIGNQVRNDPIGTK